MGIRSLFTRSACFTTMMGCALLACSGYAAAQATGSNNSSCSGSNASGSQQGSACAYNSGGLQGTFLSGGATYGTAFGGGMGSGGSGANGNTSSIGSGRFALSTRDTGKAAAGMGSNWNVWLAYSRSDLGYKYQPLQSSGHVDLTLIGADYTFANNLTAGLAVGFDQTRVGTSFNGGNLSANGYMVAPYLSWRFTPAWSLDGTLGFGHSNISQVDNSTPGGTTGSYGDDRFLGSLSLAYTKMLGKWIFTGRGAYLTSQDRYSQFTLSSGTNVSGATNHSTQLRAGGQALYNGGVVLPYVGVYYFNYVQQANQAAIGGTNPANDRDGFQLQAGIQFAPKGMVYGGIMAASDVGRSQIRNDLIMGNIGIRF
jgi:hypothetical protein